MGKKILLLNSLILTLLVGCGGGSSSGGNADSGGDSGGNTGGDTGGGTGGDTGGGTTKTSECTGVKSTFLAASSERAEISRTLSSSNAAPIDERTAAALFDVQGAITIPGGVMVDSDTADPKSEKFKSNNTIADAQPIINPVSLAGYVSTRSGNHTTSTIFTRFSYPTDLDDFFKVSLKANQIVTLYSVDSLDSSSQALCLLDQNGVETFTSTSGNAVKTLTVPKDGNYIVQVRAKGTAALYQLIIGQGSLTGSDALSVGPVNAAGALLDEDLPFVANQVLVSFKAPIGVQSFASGVTLQRELLAASPTFTASGAQVLGGENKYGLLLDIANLAASHQQKRAAQFAQGVTVDEEKLAKQATLDSIEWLRQQDDVAFAEPNYIRKAMFTPNDKLYDVQWHYPLINLPQAWDIVRSKALTETRVAVIDTGIRSHTDLNAIVVTGHDFVDKDTNPNDPGSTLSGSSNYHGTHVAGTVAAIGNNGTGVTGVAGVPDVNNNYAVKIMPLRVLDGDGSGTDANIIEAIKFAAGLSNSSGRVLSASQKAHVINMSLGGPGNSVALQNAINLARANDVLVVAAAGNENTSTKSYPGANDGVIAVGAVGPERKRASYSNFGSTDDMWVDITAPGGELAKDIDGDGQPDGVLSTWDASSYVLLQGTSMATPHAAGVFAMMRALNPSLTAANIETLIESGSITTDLGATGQDAIFGRGLIDAALAAGAASGEGIPAVLVLTPERLNFGSSEQTLSLRASNGGTEPLAIVGITANQSWLTITGDSVDPADGTGDYLVQVSREGLEIGVYTGKLTIELLDNSTRDVTVIMQVPDPDAGVDASRHYVLLIPVDPVTGEPQFDDDLVQQRTAEAKDNGSYEFKFSSINDDVYYIIAGTDMDNDGFICDEGEFCGEYPVLNQPQEIIVPGENNENLLFSTNYLLGFGQTSSDIGSKQGRKGFPRKQESANE
ncbi:MAG: S8 family serine peptidase [Hahellaceae bacterium]|nr:S8 family serine peptidase [Hahellaceae bacterium]MCP5210937.1 S8 family serine peptidase [Hahellaceae bacterium]